MRKIAASMYREANAERGTWFESEPDEALLSALAEKNPRRAVRIIDLAMGFAAQEGRQSLTPADIAAAAALIETHQEEAREGDGFREVRGKVGFIHHRSEES